MLLNIQPLEMEKAKKQDGNSAQETKGAQLSKFKILQRDPGQLSGSWRLASHDEGKQALDKGILDLEDCNARLLDGFIYKGKFKIKYEPAKYEPHTFDHMLAVHMDKEKSRPPSPDDSFPEKLYSGIESTPDKRKTTLFLSCEDHNTEVIFWVLKKLQEESNKDAKLDRLMASLKMTLSGDRTVLHYAVDQPYLKQYEKHALEISKLLWKKFTSGKELVRTLDKQGRTALHYAAYHECSRLCKYLIEECELRVDQNDRKGENVLHIAVDRNHQSEFVHDLLEWDSKSPKLAVITSPDRKRKTPLHKAAANGNKCIVEFLMQSFKKYKSKETPDGSSQKLTSEEYICQADIYGQTPLLDAARKGHTEVVSYLVEEGSRPLHERNADGKTALHYAVKLPDEHKADDLTKLLMRTSKMSDEQKYLLLCNSAVGVGTAEESTSHPTISKYLEDQKSDLEKNLKETDLLLLMVKGGHVQMGLELVNRGANAEKIRDPSKNKDLEDTEKDNVEMFLNHVDKAPERGTDQPAKEDSLGRSAFAEGLAALFLNPVVKSPVTVGIFGSWGMGKSSIMRQTENLLLKEASQLAFPDLLEVNSIPGCEQFDKPQNCRYKKIRHAIKSLKNGEDGLVNLLNNYDEKHEKVYRFLALMDRRQLFPPKHSLAKIPSLLTVWYNAWHYKKEMEAWAGLAVQITKAIEETMTTAQRIRVSFKYVWNQQRGKIWLQLILPCLLALVSAGLVAWVAWSVLNRSNIKEIQDIKYGSIPLTIVGIVWTVVRQLLSVIKPISDQLMGYVQWNDHIENLGYQQKVIDDIEYLKNEITKEPCWVWKFMAWTWNLLNLRLFADFVEGTWIFKSHSVSHPDGHLRIIVFVDDLDRCEDSIILQVMSAVNLVLAACKIDVILGVDKEMLERAIANKFGNNNSQADYMEDMAEKYMGKIIQLPLALPDPDNTETGTFLKQHMGPAFQETDRDANSNVNEGQSSTEIVEMHAGIEEKEKQKGVQQGGASDRVLCQCPPKRLAGFWSKIWELFCPSISHASIKLTCTLKSHEQRLKNMTLIQSYVPNLSKQEQQALRELSEVATDTRKLPREWKRFLTYHRLAWNILCKKDEVKALAGWQVQLVVWIFCCWQWKHQINAIIESWESIVSVKRTTGDIKEDEGPSLQRIVDYYIDKILPSKMKEKLNKEKAEIEELNKEKAEKEKASEKDWMALSETLTKYDVSMKGIFCFQDFRLHCKVGDLPAGYKLKDELENK